MNRINQGIRTLSAETCYLCRTCGDALYSGQYDRLFEMPGVWNLRHCPKCGLVWLHPFPVAQDIAKLYPKNYMAHTLTDPPPRRLGKLKDMLSLSLLSACFGYDTPDNHKGIGRLLGRIGFLRDLIGRRVSWLEGSRRGRLLDIGCGTGTFLVHMRALGWEVAGVEPDPGAVTIAQRLLGTEAIHQGILEEAALPADSFDAITMSHVIEHVPEPVNTLKACMQVLKPGGKLVVLTPNVESLGHRIFSNAWRPLEVPRHLFLFSPYTLGKCAIKAGLKIEGMRTSSAGGRYVWITSRLLRQYGTMYGGRLPCSLPLNYHLESFGFWILESIITLFRSLGEEVVMIATK